MQIHKKCLPADSRQVAVRFAGRRDDARARPAASPEANYDDIKTNTNPRRRLLVVYELGKKTKPKGRMKVEWKNVKAIKR